MDLRRVLIIHKPHIISAVDPDHLTISIGDKTIQKQWVFVKVFARKKNLMR